ncbi:MAG: hypothetical protein IKF64_08425, partial [Eubacterium sp.]|nr:hypothetical protein [Eubacterium sp.]
IDLFTDGHLETFDLRYRDVVGKRVKKKLMYAIMQLCPTNMFDAVSRLAKFFVGVALIALIALLITMFK